MTEIISISVAAISLIISMCFFVIRKQSKFDLLMSFYDRLQSANAELQLAKGAELAEKLIPNRQVKCI